MVVIVEHEMRDMSFDVAIGDPTERTLERGVCKCL